MNMKDQTTSRDIILLDVNIQDDAFEFATSIASAQARAEFEKQIIEQDITDSLETVRSLTPDCDRLTTEIN